MRVVPLLAEHPRDRVEEVSLSFTEVVERDDHLAAGPAEAPAKIAEDVAFLPTGTGVVSERGP